MKTGRIAIACGGTGGHLFPGLSVAGELLARGHEIKLIISSKPIDAQVVSKYPEFPSIPLSAIGWPGIGPKAVLFAWKLFKTQVECARLFKDWKPSAVLGMGGFTSAVPLLLASKLSVPSLIHESNAIPGKVTRQLAPHVGAVLVGFHECEKELPAARSCVFTGTPVRPGLVGVDRGKACEQLGLEPGRKTLLVMGGSQGAHGINEAVIQCLPSWGEHRENWQFIHLTGSEDLAIVEYNYRREKFKAKVLEFCHDMAPVYSASDLALSRSGAGTLAELGNAGVPSVLIPYPHAAENHQYHNAKILEKAGAAVVVEQGQIGEGRLAHGLGALLENSAMLEKMSMACRAFSPGDAAKNVACAVEARFV